MIIVGYINKNRIANDIEWFEEQVENFIEMYNNIIDYEDEIYYKIISYEIDDEDYISDYNGCTFIKIKLEVEFLFVNESEEYDDVYDEEYIEKAKVPIIKNENPFNGDHEYNILVLDFDFNINNDFILIIDEMDVSYDDLKDYYEEYLE